MLIRKLQYWMLLFGAAAYYLSSGEWVSWILLLTAAGLPWVSLLLSLPALFTLRVEPVGTCLAEVGETVEVGLSGRSVFPVPPFRGRLVMTDLMYGNRRTSRWSWQETAEHCGACRITAEKVRICDYLGVFSFRRRRTGEMTLVVRPKPLPVVNLSDPRRQEKNRWVPKPGGGFSENHEHRLYRPGDSLNQIHWKLSAKVGDLIVREPMEPVRSSVLLTMTLRGSPEELDRMLGRLMWLGDYLLEREPDFELRALTGKGILSEQVSSHEGLLQAVDRLLCTPAAAPDAQWREELRASWHYHIGGDADEA